MKIIIEVVLDSFKNIANFFKSNLRIFANILYIVAPYVMYFIGQYVANDRNDICVGGEVFIPLIFIVLAYILKSSYSIIPCITFPKKRRK